MGIKNRTKKQKNWNKKRSERRRRVESFDLSVKCVEGRVKKKKNLKWFDGGRRKIWNEMSRIVIELKEGKWNFKCEKGEIEVKLLKVEREV